MATIYYSASSLDGFIAGPGHSLEWLLSRDIDPGGPQSFAAFTAGVGAGIMGANTYQWILDHGDEPWAPELPSWVMTHRALCTTTCCISDMARPEELLPMTVAGGAWRSISSNMGFLTS